MKYLKIRARIDGCETTVLGRGDDRYTTNRMVERICKKIETQRGADRTEPNVDVLSSELIGADSFEEESDKWFSYDVTRRTEEPYGDCYYGSQYRETPNTRARGPVGYSKLVET